MFTGLVEELGIISEITQTEIWIEASVVMKDLGIKDSISVNAEGITLDFPYFRELKGDIPILTYDPFHRDINYFDHNYR